MFSNIFNNRSRIRYPIFHLRFYQGAKKPDHLLLVCNNYHVTKEMLDVFEAFPADRVRFIYTRHAPGPPRYARY